MKDSQLPMIIGCEKELFFIKDLIMDGDACNALCIHGPGGIGKTKLLQQVYETYRVRDGWLLPPIFDFDDPFLFVVQSAEEEIATRLDEDRQYFSKYFNVAFALNRQGPRLIGWRAGFAPRKPGPQIKGRPN